MADDIVEQVRQLQARADLVLDKEARGHLISLYGMIWTEAFYDGRNQSTADYAATLWPHIEALNDKLKFRT